MARAAGTAILGFLLVFSLQSASAGQLKWVGCGITQTGFIEALAAAYENQTGTSIVIERGGATRGIRAVAAGEADMGGSCRHKILHDAEKNTRLIPVGWDALVAIVHSSNPAQNLSLSDLKGIFEGRITNWREVGGPDAKIAVVVREGKTSGVGLLVRELLFQNPAFEFPKSAIIEKSTTPLEKRVEKDPHAIAFTGVSSARKRNVMLVNLDGQIPSYENIAAGRYALVRPLYLVVPKIPSAEVAEFARYATGAAGQTVIKNAGTVNLADGSNLWPHFQSEMKKSRKAGNF